MSSSASVIVKTLEWAGKRMSLCHSEQQSDDTGAARFARGVHPGQVSLLRGNEMSLFAYRPGNL